MARAFEARLPGIIEALEDVGVVGPDTTVLDIGTGPRARFATAAADELGCRVLAIDAKPRPLWRPHPLVEYRHDTVTAKKVREIGRHDAVLALSVLHHTRRWRELFTAMRHTARSVLIVEVPAPDEQLEKADARADLAELYTTVCMASIGVIARSPATRQPELEREVHVIPPLLTGVMVDGGGHHAANSEALADRFTEELGWRPFPGSLNVRVGHGADLKTRPHGVVIREREGATDRRYRLWHARILEAPDIPAALMACRDRPQGKSVEILAPTRLRDLLDPEAFVNVEVLPEVQPWM